jgi:UDP-3-O-[3-hydroxymyristoyl] glucosamine N-acyltransferase
MVGAQSGVTKSVPADSVVTGFPAVSHSLWKRLSALTQKLPELFRRTRDLDERVRRIEQERATEEERVR